MHQAMLVEGGFHRRIGEGSFRLQAPVGRGGRGGG